MTINAPKNFDFLTESLAAQWLSTDRRRVSGDRGEGGRTILLTGLALALAACGGQRGNGTGQVPQPLQASLSLSSDSNTGNTEDSATNLNEIVLEAQSNKQISGLELTVQSPDPNSPGQSLSEILVQSSEAGAPDFENIVLEAGMRSIAIPRSVLTENGQYTFRLRQGSDDRSGEIIAEQVVIVDRLLPMVPVVGLSDSGDSLSLELTRPEITDLRVTGAEKGSRVVVLLDGEPLGGEVSVSETGEGSITLSEADRNKLRLGENKLTLKTVDQAGNQVEREITITVTDPVPVEGLLSLSAASETGQSGSGFTAGTVEEAGQNPVPKLTLDISGNAEAREGLTLWVSKPGKSGLEPVLTDENVPLNLNIAANEEVTVDVAIQNLQGSAGEDVQEGEYDFELRNAEGLTVATLNVILDRTPPTSVTLEWQGGQADENGTVAGTQDDLLAGSLMFTGGESGNTVSVLVGQVMRGTSVTLNENGEGTFDLSLLTDDLVVSDEPLVIEVRTEDQAGNRVTEFVNLVVNPSSLVVLSVADESDSGVKGDHKIQGLTDLMLRVDSVKTDQRGVSLVVVKPGETEEKEISTELELNADGTGTTELTLPTAELQEEGTYVIRLKGSDGSVLEELQVEVDRTAVSSDVLDLKLVGDTDLASTRENIREFEVTAEGGSRLSLVREDDRTQVLLEGTILEGQTKRIFVVTEEARGQLATGENVLMLLVEDDAGNRTEKMFTVTVEEPSSSSTTVALSAESKTGTGERETQDQSVLLVVSTEDTREELASQVVRLVRKTEEGQETFIRDIGINEWVQRSDETGGYTVSVDLGTVDPQASATETYIARVMDRKGTVNTEDDQLIGEAFEFTVDTEAPELVVVNTDLGTATDPVLGSSVVEIAGTGESGATVKVLLGEQEIGTATVNADGAFVVMLDETVRDLFKTGGNDLSIQQIDGAGNASEVMMTTLYVEPDPTAAVVLDPGSDTGTQGDDRTNGETVVLSVGVGEGSPDLENAVVRIEQAGQPDVTLGVVTDGAGGYRVTFATGVQQDQTETFVARVLTSATDSTALSGDYTFVVDRQGAAEPTVTTNLGTATEPLAISTLTEVTGVTEPGAKVQMSVGGQAWGPEVTADENGNYQIPIGETERGQLVLGSNEVTIQTTDEAGNRGTEGVQTVYVEPDPTAAVVLDPGSDTGTQGDDRTNGETVVLSVGVGEGSPDLESAVVQIEQAGQPDVTLGVVTDGAGGYRVTFAAGVQQDQTETFVARVLTSATDSTALSGDYTFVVDRQGAAEPTVTTNLGTATEPLAISTLTEVTGVTEPGAKVQMSVGGQAWGPEVTADENGNYQIPIGETERGQLVLGSNEVTIQTTDEAGNRGTEGVQTVYVEPDPTAAVVLDPGSDTGTQGDDRTNGETVVLSVGVGEGSPDLESAVVQIEQAGQPDVTLGVVTDGAGGYRVTFAAGVQQDQTETFVARVLTSATDSTALSGDYTFVVDRQGAAEPTVTTNLGTATEPLAISTLTEVTGVTEPGAKVQMSVGGQAWGPEVTADENGNYQIPIGETERGQLVLGSNEVTIQTTDEAGNRGTEGVQTVYVEPDPTAAVVLDPGSDTGTQGDDRTNGETVVLSVGVGEGSPDLENAVVQIEQAGQPDVTLGVVTDGAGGYRVTFATGVQQDQTETFVARVLTSATDSTALSGDYTFVVDRQGAAEPTVTTNLGTATEPLAISTLTEVTGVTEPGAKVQMSVGGQAWGPEVTADENGNYQIPIGETERGQLVLGSNEVTIQTTDEAGNRGTEGVQTVYVEPDPTAAVVLDPGSDTGTQGDDRTNGETVVLSVGVGEGSPDLENAVVQIEQAGQPDVTLGVVTDGAGGYRVTFATGVQQDQTETFVARVLTSATDSTALSGDYTFVVDRQGAAEPTVTTNLGTATEPLAISTLTEVTGVTEPGAKVQMSVGGQAWGSEVTADENGNYQIPIGETERGQLVLGSNEVTIQTTDEAGNRGTEGVQTVYVEPDPTAAVVLDPGSDTGTQGDDRTNGETVVLSVGVGEGSPDLESAVVQIEQAGQPDVTLGVVTDGAGGYRVTFAAGVQQDQTETFVARVLTSATDSTALSGDYTFVVDRQGAAEPTVTTNLGTATEPLAISTLTEVTGVTEPGAKVQMSVGGQAWGPEVTADENGNYQIPIGETERGQLVLGSNEVTIQTTDEAGNRGTEGVQTVYVEPDPTAAVVLDPGSDTGTQGDDRTNGETVVLSVGVGEGSPDLENAVVRIEQAGQPDVTLGVVTDGAGGYRVTFATGVQQDQTETFVARVLTSATDSTALSTENYTFVVDRQGAAEPTVTTNLGTATEPLAISTLTEVTGVTEPGAKVQMSVGGQAWGSEVTADENGNYQIPIGETERGQLVLGSNEVTIQTTDEAGNRGTEGVQTVYVEPDPTAAVVLDPGSDTGTQGDDRTNGETVVLSVGVGEGSPDLESAVVQIEQAGQPDVTLGVVTDGAGGYRVTFAAGVQQDQTETFVARVLTSATDSTALSGDYTFVVDRQGAAEPTVTTNLGTATEPLAISTLTEVTGVTEPGAKVQMSVGGQAWGPEVTADENGNYQIPIGETERGQLVLGSNEVTIQTTDEAGNRGTEGVQTVYVEPDPTAAVVLDPGSDTGTQGDDRTNGETVVLSVGVGEGSPDLENAVVRIEQAGQPDVTLGVVTDGAGGYRVTFATGVQQDQTETFVARVLTSATDSTALSTENYTFVVDRQGAAEPTVTTNLGTATEPLAISTLTEVAGVTEPGAKVQMSVGGQAWGPEVTADENGNYQIPIGETERGQLVLGSNEVTIQTTDEAGNRGTERVQTVYVEPDPAAVIDLPDTEDLGISSEDDITSRSIVFLLVNPIGSPDLANAVVQLERDGQPYVTLELLSGGSGTYSTPFFDTGIQAGQTGMFAARVLTSATDSTPLSTEDLTFVVDLEDPTVTVTTNVGTATEPVAISSLTEVAGVTKPGARVQMSLGGQAWGPEVTADENGNYQIPIGETERSLLVLGSNTVMSRATDIAGNTGQESQVTVYLEPDPTAVLVLPHFVDTGISSADGISMRMGVTLEVDVGEGSPDLENAVVQVELDGQPHITSGLTLDESSGKYYTPFFDVGVQPGQTGTLVARVLTSATDSTPLSTEDYTFEIDREPPTVTVTTNLGTETEPLTFSSLTEVAGVTEPGARVQMSLGGQNWGPEVTADENGNYQIPIGDTERGQLVVGSNELTITATDIAGNEEVIMDTVYVEPDILAVIGIFAIDDTGISSSDGITSKSSFALRASQTGSQTLENAVLEVQQEGGTTSTFNMFSGGVQLHRSWGTEGTTETFVARVLKSATDSTPLSLSYTLVVDLEDPIVTVTTNVGTATEPVAISSLTEVAGVTEPGARVQMSLGGQNWGPEVTADESGNYQIPIGETERSLLVLGSNTVMSRATDIAGNTGQESQVTVYLEPDPTAVLVLPHFMDTGISSADGISMRTDVTLEVDVGEGSPDLENAVVQVELNGQPHTTSGLTLNESAGKYYTIFFDSGVQPGQTGTLVARVLTSATDSTPLSTEDYTFEIDREPPTTVTVTTNLGTATEPVALSSVTEVAGVTEPGARVQISLGGQNWGPEVTADENGNYQIPIGDTERGQLVVGSNELTITATDIAGNEEVIMDTVYVEPDISPAIAIQESPLGDVVQAEEFSEVLGVGNLGDDTLYG